MPQWRIGISPSSFAEADDAPLKLLEEYGVAIVPNPHKRRLTESEAAEFVRDLDGLIAGLEPLNEKVLSSAPRLKAIARVGIGLDNVDQACASGRGIKVSNTPDGPTVAVAELTVTALLALLRKLRETDADMHTGRWNKKIGTGLQGLRILIIGYGRIGRKTAELLRAFGPKIMVCDPLVPASSLAADEESVDLKSGLSAADVISLHAGGKAEILGFAEFRAMKDGVVLLNSARGELVSEKALIEALDAGRIAGAWFDAFWEEPYRGPLVNYPQVLLTPHIGTYTGQCRSDMEWDAVLNILRDLDVPLSKKYRRKPS